MAACVCLVGGGRGGRKCEHLRGVRVQFLQLSPNRYASDTSKQRDKLILISFKRRARESLFQPPTLENEKTYEVLVSDVFAGVALLLSQSRAQATPG